ncbi:PadR family transcriptional regulator [Georgenia halophila]|uniref:PadR family transcriptional regulator n=1 Tax=Georgenia halophila TaxID=620889 RepID=A0ABP8L7G1_9MICO
MAPAPATIMANLRRGVVEYCVLATLRRGPAYGRDLAVRLTDEGVLTGGEGTLYPLLSRLRRSGLVETSWQESPAGPPRRYYILTPGGEHALAGFVEAWKPFCTAVDRTLGAPS